MLHEVKLCAILGLPPSKQLAFFNAERLHCFFPKMLKVVHKKTFYEFITIEGRKV